MFLKQHDNNSRANLTRIKLSNVVFNSFLRQNKNCADLSRVKLSNQLFKLCSTPNMSFKGNMNYIQNIFVYLAEIENNFKNFNLANTYIIDFMVLVDIM